MAETKKIKTVLWSHTENPIETIYCLWEKSKNVKFNIKPKQIAEMCKFNPEIKKNVHDTFRKILRQNVPVAENVSFTFMIENDPIAHREQMVRHRIGTKFGDNFGVDILPMLEQSTWWSQSMRIANYGNFFEDGKYFIPESLESNPIALAEYKRMMEEIGKSYKYLDSLGVPIEDVRGLMPLHTTMDISWTVNLASLQHIIGKRSCFILQYGYWGYIISDMVDELCNEIDPIFRELILPPCFKDGEFSGCEYKFENERREDERDPLPLCPLYFFNHLDDKAKVDYTENHTIMADKMNRYSEKYEKLWGRNPFTGKLEN
jgi:thymidylate synthase ThyX